MRAFIVVCIVVMAGLVWGCGSSSPTVAKIGKDHYTLMEFEEDFAKNNGGWEQGEKSSFEERQKFLNLMVNYRLKVKEAYELGLANDKEVKTELKLYRSSVAQSYILEKELVVPAIKQIYDRKKEMLRASHILIRVAQEASPEDTLKAYEKAMSIIAEIPTTPFDSLARRYSQDPSVHRNGGDLGYFTSGRMVGEFEDACYSLKKGEYTKTPVRTSYGYHIIKLTDRRQNEGAVKIAHLIIELPNPDDSLKIRDSVWAIYREIKSGLPFDSAVARYSADYNTRQVGGYLGDYTRDRLPVHLGDILFTTATDSITEPVGFNYGYHIFKVKGFTPLSPFNDIEKEIRSQYQQTRFLSDKNKFISSFYKQYNVQINEAVLDELSVAFDTTKTPAVVTWKDTVSPALLEKVLIRTSAGTYTVEDVLDKINNMQEFSNLVLTSSNVKSMVTKVAENAGFDQYALQRISAYPELNKLLRDYQDGILLYRIEQSRVWNSISVNDSLLREFYETRKENYRWPDRVNFAEIYVVTDSAAKATYEKLKKGEDFLELAEKTTQRVGYKEKKGVWGFHTYNANPLAERASKMAVDSVTEPFRYQGGWSILKVLAFDEARVKTFEEATPELIGAYQDFQAEKLKGQWVEQLRKKYTVIENLDVLREAFKKKH